MVIGMARKKVSSAVQYTVKIAAVGFLGDGDVGDFHLRRLVVHFDPDVGAIAGLRIALGQADAAARDQAKPQRPDASTVTWPVLPGCRFSLHFCQPRP